MKKLTLALGLGSVSAMAVPLTTPIDMVSDLTTTASNFGTSSLQIWGGVALVVIGVIVFKKIFG